MKSTKLCVYSDDVYHDPLNFNFVPPRLLTFALRHSHHDL